MAYKKGLKLISFGIKNKKATISLINIKKEGKKFRLKIMFNKKKKYFWTTNNFQNNTYNILASLAVISIFDIFIKRNYF